MRPSIVAIAPHPTARHPDDTAILHPTLFFPLFSFLFHSMIMMSTFITSAVRAIETTVVEKPTKSQFDPDAQ
jgi:hypothetical protein